MPKKPSTADLNLLQKVLKLFLGLFGLTMGSGPPPTPRQVKEFMQRPDFAEKAQQFFNNPIVKLAMKSKYIAGEVSKYLEQNPAMKAAVQEGIKANPALQKVLETNAKGQMKDIVNDLLPKTPMTRPTTTPSLRSAASCAQDSVAPKDMDTPDEPKVTETHKHTQAGG